MAWPWVKYILGGISKCTGAITKYDWMQKNILALLHFTYYVLGHTKSFSGTQNRIVVCVLECGVSSLVGMPEASSNQSSQRNKTQLAAMFIPHCIREAVHLSHNIFSTPLFTSK